MTWAPKAALSRSFHFSFGLWALDDVRTEALAELRGVLLQEHE